jgi:hypothetical protein
MSSAPPRGPDVDAAEDLHRGITVKEWWVPAEQRPSSAAFDAPTFSVDVASLTTIAQTTHSLHVVMCKPQAGIVAFNCGEAKSLGFSTHLELDQRFPENTAHAHVYYDGSGSSRKKNARKLAGKCRTVLVPSF